MSKSNKKYDNVANLFAILFVFFVKETPSPLCGWAVCCFCDGLPSRRRACAHEIGCLAHTAVS